MIQHFIDMRQKKKLNSHNKQIQSNYIDPYCAKDFIRFIISRFLLTMKQHEYNTLVDSCRQKNQQISVINVTTVEETYSIFRGFLTPHGITLFVMST